jgi:hypothetical protein
MAAAIPLPSLSLVPNAAPANLAGELAQLKGRPEKATQPLSSGIGELDGFLPQGGFGLGVTEFQSPLARGGGTSLAASTISALHACNPHANVAWVDPEGTLYAPFLAAAKVDLQRLLVVQPSWRDSRRIASKLVSSQAFDLVVVDMHAPSLRGMATDERAVRRLALASMPVIILTNSRVTRSIPWATNLRLELERRPEALAVTIGKDKLGHTGKKTLVPLPSAS